MFYYKRSLFVIAACVFFKEILNPADTKFKRLGLYKLDIFRIDLQNEKKFKISG